MGALAVLVEAVYAVGDGARVRVCDEAFAAVIWELGEYVAFVRKSPELQTAYTDTLGDETLGTLGALTAALLLARRARRHP